MFLENDIMFWDPCYILVYAGIGQWDEGGWNQFKNGNLEKNL